MPKENQFYNLLIFAKGLEEHSWLETTEDLDQLREKKPQKCKKIHPILWPNSKGKK